MEETLICYGSGRYAAHVRSFLIFHYIGLRRELLFGALRSPSLNVGRRLFYNFLPVSFDTTR